MLRRGIPLLALLLFDSAGVVAQSGDHTYSTEAIQQGSRFYMRQCALCHGPNGSTVDGINLSLGQFRTAVTDEDLRRTISEGAAEGRMPAFDLPASAIDGLIAYIRSGFDPDSTSVQIGSVVDGQALFEEAGECSSCHRVNGRGPRMAPDLSDIGLIRTPASLQRSLKEPAAALLPINRPVTLITRHEETIVGRRLNEDTYTVQLIDSEDRLRSLHKADLVSYEISDKPTHRPTTLTDDQVADLIAYLLSLRGES